MDKCVFCMIDKGEIPSPKVFENEDFFIIKDIEPKAELHYLAIPHKHFKYLSQMDEQDSVLVAKMLKKIADLQSELGLADGYRLVVNQGDDAGQTVPHLHVHILGGQKMDFPHF